MSESAQSQFANGRKHPWAGSHLPEAWRLAVSKGSMGKPGNRGNLGQKHSDETRAKIRAKRVGQQFSEETRAKISAAHKRGYAEGRRVSYFAGKPAWSKGQPRLDIRGDKHPLWKGGTTPQTLQIRHSLEYKNWRRAVFERDGFACQSCQVSGGALEADHVLPFATHPESRFDVDNGRALCKPCHRLIGARPNQKSSPFYQSKA